MFCLEVLAVAMAMVAEVSFMPMSFPEKMQNICSEKLQNNNTKQNLILCVKLHLKWIKIEVKVEKDQSASLQMHRETGW